MRFRIILYISLALFICLWSVAVRRDAERRFRENNWYHRTWVISIPASASSSSILFYITSSVGALCSQDGVSWPARVTASGWACFASDKPALAQGRTEIEARAKEER